jgi:hypothetical protein
MNPSTRGTPQIYKLVVFLETINVRFTGRRSGTKICGPAEARLWSFRIARICFSPLPCSIAVSRIDET